MISLESLKKPAMIKQIQDHESPSQIFENIWSPSELLQIINISKLCYADTENTNEKLLKKGQPPLGSTAHPKAKNKAVLEKILRNKLSHILDEPYEIDFSFHRNYFPYGMHTDSGYDPEECIYKQGIVPLEIYPSHGEVYTVIFKQKVYHSVSFPRQLKTIHAIKPEEWSVIKGLTQESSPQQAQKFWPGCTAWLTGFSINLAFRWVPGNMAIWNRSQLHCSSDFQHIKGKLGLMWITRKLNS